MIVDKRNAQVEVAGKTADTSQRQGALVVGVGLILMFILAMFATFLQGSVFVAGDAAATANHILANELQFRLVMFSFMMVVVLDVIVAWGLYVFFRPVNRSLSLLAAWFRLVYAALFAMVILNLGNVLGLLHAADTGTLPGTEGLQAQALLTLNAFADGWDLALAVFGLHLIVVGYLVFKVDYMPKLLAALVFVCGLGYLFDSITGLLLPGFGLEVTLVTFIGEMLLGLWLLAKSVSIRHWDKLALESA